MHTMPTPFRSDGFESKVGSLATVAINYEEKSRLEDRKT